MELSGEKTKLPAAMTNKPNIKINLKSDSKVAAPSVAAAVATVASPAAGVSKIEIQDDADNKPTPAVASVNKTQENKPKTPGNQAVAIKPPANVTKATTPPAKPQNSHDIIRMMTNEMPIHISNKNPKTYTFDNCTTFVQEKNNATWDMVIINHNQKYNKAEIIEALFKLVGDIEFYPVAYRPSRKGDLFLMRNCGAALSKLFLAKLRLLMADGQEIGLTIKLDVAPFKVGQITMRNKLLKLLKLRRQSTITVDGLPKVLNLSALAADPEMAEIVMSFGSPWAVSQLIDIIQKNSMDMLGSVSGIRLADNGLRRLSSFRFWPRTYVHLLDMSGNCIEDVFELKFLDKIVFVELLVTGNPFTQTPNYMVEIRNMFPAVKTINGTEVSQLPTKPNGMVMNPMSAAAPRTTTTTTTSATKPVPLPVPAPTLKCKPTELVLNPAAIASIDGVQMVINPAAVTSAASAISPPSASPATSHKIACPDVQTQPRPVPPPRYVPPTQPPISPKSTAKPAPIVAATNAPTAPPPTLLKVKSFATINSAPLPNDPQALAGGPCADAGDVIFVDACRSGTTAIANFLRKYKTSTMWHRVVVNHGGAHCKRDILDSLWQTLGPVDMQPCYYAEFAVCDTFFVRNAYDALERLVGGSKLLMRVLSTSAPCSLTLHMNVASYKTGQIDAAEQIHATIGKCFTAMDNTLDLSRFAEHAELAHVEVRLSNAATLASVLMQSARRYLANVHRLRLADNGLTGTLGMRPLTWMKELRVVDLSDNQIESVGALAAMPSLQTIEEFELHGNPLPVMEPLAYINAVKGYLPNLVRLDGHALGESGCSVTHQNYLCSLEGRDLVEQFCEHYFEMMDGMRLMKYLYSDRALMTMSCSLSGMTGDDAMLQNYALGARNLWRGPPMSTAAANKLYIGGDAIEARWQSFGGTVHDYGSFTIDLVHYTPLVAVFTVNGMYKEGDTVLGFVRTFVLRKESDGLGMFGYSSRHVIVNEQVLVYRPSMLQLGCAFARRPAPRLAAGPDGMGGEGGVEMSAEEKDGVVIVFQEITNLLPVWCTKFLEMADWHLRQALEMYVHLCEEDKVPDMAFADLTNSMRVG